jgi:hypothetical protein
MNSISRVTLGSMVLGRWAARWGTLGQLWALLKEGEGEKLMGQFWVSAQEAIGEREIFSISILL